MAQPDQIGRPAEQQLAVLAVLNLGGQRPELAHRLGQAHLVSVGEGLPIALAGARRMPGEVVHGGEVYETAHGAHPRSVTVMVGAGAIFIGCPSGLVMSAAAYSGMTARCQGRCLDTDLTPPAP